MRNSNASMLKHASNVIGVTSKPYFTNSLNDIRTSLSFRILIHIMPARAPMGVIFAPRFDPMIVANTAGNNVPCDCELAMGTYATVIGILLRKFAANVEEMP